MKYNVPFFITNLFVALFSDNAFAIVNGVDSGPTFDSVAPHTVALQMKYKKEDGTFGYRKGSAVLLESDVLLTAGHNAHRPEIIEIEAIFSKTPCWGENICNEFRIPVLKRVFHPNYSDPMENDIPLPPKNDLALLKLAGVAPASYLPAVLIGKTQTFNNLLTIAGFGMSKDLDSNVPLSDFRLRSSQNLLAGGYDLGGSEQFSIEQTQSGACAGDSGGPAFANGKNGLELIGIFSRVGRDSSGHMKCLTQGIFSDLLFYREWIDQTLQILHNKWFWSDFEIIGNSSVSKLDILNTLPKNLIGTEYVLDQDQWKAWCAPILQKFDLAHIECTSLRWMNFKAFLVVEIVEKFESDRNNFRTISKPGIHFSTPELVTLHNKLYERLWRLFEVGKPPKENVEKGYLDWDDEEMRAIVQEIIAIVPHKRSEILDVLKSGEASADRQIAANLLNWTLAHQENLKAVLELLDDPDRSTRNNISRYALHFLENLSGGNTGGRQKALQSFLKQIERPSHGDRNKGLFCLQEMLRLFPQESKSYLKNHDGFIKRIAAQSILDNVGKIAHEILNALGE